jgi:hypothetical protein
MPLYQIAFLCAGVLVVPLAVIQVVMRQQAHDATYGFGAEISPFDARSLSDMISIWRAHKRAYERSVLRCTFIVIAVAWLVSVLVATFAFFGR